MSNLQEPVPKVQNGITLGSGPLWPCCLSKQTHLQHRLGLGHWNTSWHASTIARIDCTGAKQCLVVGGEFLMALALLHTWLALEDMGVELPLKARKKTDATSLWRAVRLWVHHLLVHTGYLQPVYFSQLPSTEQHTKLGPCCAGLAACPTANSWGAGRVPHSWKLPEDSPSCFYKGPTLEQVVTAHQIFWITMDCLLLFFWEHLVCAHS